MIALGYILDVGIRLMAYSDRTPEHPGLQRAFLTHHVSRLERMPFLARPLLWGQYRIAIRFRKLTSLQRGDEINGHGNSHHV